MAQSQPHSPENAALSQRVAPPGPGTLDIYMIESEHASKLTYLQEEDHIMLMVTRIAADGGVYPALELGNGCNLSITEIGGEKDQPVLRVHKVQLKEELFLMNLIIYII